MCSPWRPWAAPPDRKDEGDEIGAGEPRLLARNIGREAAMRARMQLLGLIVEARRVGDRGEIVPARHRVEALAVEIGDLDRMAVGGQGAPLVPLADCLLFGDEKEGRVLLNIGGIANVTIVPAGARPEDVCAFDTGPGNMLIDAAVERATGGRERFDRGGLRAARGAVDSALLERLMQHPYLRREPPKSTGREEFGAAFLAEIARPGAYEIGRAHV